MFFCVVRWCCCSAMGRPVRWSRGMTVLPLWVLPCATISSYDSLWRRSHDAEALRHCCVVIGVSCRGYYAAMQRPMLWCVVDMPQSCGRCCGCWAYVTKPQQNRRLRSEQFELVYLVVETKSVVRCDPVFPDGKSVLARRVALVLRPAVHGVLFVETLHVLVAMGLGQY